MKKIIILIFIFIILFLNVSCNKQEYAYKTYYLDETFSITPIITIMDEINVIENLNIENDLNEITLNLDKKFNVFKEDSLITKVNNNSGIKEIEVDDEFIFVLQNAINVSKNIEAHHQKSLYDVSIFSVWKEWGFHNNYYQYGNYSSSPSFEVIKRKLPLVNYKDIIINNEKNTVFLKTKGMMIDLGSIVKGYAADKIASYLKTLNLNNCLIDVGGNIVTLGKNVATLKNWKVGILAPYTYDTEIGYIIANDSYETFVTSGIYERYIVEKNKETNEEIMYHHILNPNTGYPEDNDLLSVTIITKQSIIADGLSTAIFLMGSAKGMEYVNANNDIDAIFITKNKEILVSNNIENRFVINKDIYNFCYIF